MSHASAGFYAGIHENPGSRPVRGSQPARAPGSRRNERRNCSILLDALTALAISFALAFPCHRAEAQSVQASTAESYSSVRVKAAFLFHFGAYVTWPKQADNGDPITIAVLDAPEVAAELERIVVGRTIQGHRVEIKRLRNLRALGDPELLFVGANDNRRLKEIFEQIGQRPTLTVTDAPDGLAAGSMINFQIVDNHERFEISLTRARNAGLMLSSRLLAAALRVETTLCGVFCHMQAPAQTKFASRSPRPASFTSVRLRCSLGIALLVEVEPQAQHDGSGTVPIVGVEAHGDGIREA